MKKKPRQRVTAKLVQAGHEVTVWNRSEGPVQALQATCDVAAFATPAEAVLGNQFAISMLADGPTTERVLLDPAVLAALGADAVVCDMATSGVESARRLNAVLDAAQIRFVDAPVSGSVPTIEAGQLLVMASGSASGIAAIEPVLLAFAKRVMALGEAGAGQAMKLAVNLVVHSLNAAVSEALALASAGGVEFSDAYDVFQESVIAAPFVNYKRAAFLDQSLPPAMTLALSRKDLSLINDYAQSMGIHAEVVGAALAEVSRACESGIADRDMSALAGFLSNGAAT